MGNYIDKKAGRWSVHRYSDTEVIIKDAEDNYVCEISTPAGDMDDREKFISKLICAAPVMFKILEQCFSDPDSEEFEEIVKHLIKNIRS